MFVWLGGVSVIIVIWVSRFVCCLICIGFVLMLRIYFVVIVVCFVLRFEVLYFNSICI